MSTAVAGKGLEGVVAANSGICWIDGEAGVLSYRGIDIHELALHSTFEETTSLLWNGILPNELELREFQSQLTLARSLDQRMVQMLRSFPRTATPMEVLRTAVSALSFYDADEKDNSHEANVRKCFNLTAQFAMIVAIYDRLRKGLKIVPPDRSLNHAANFLWMLNGVKPSETAVKTMDMALVLHAEHELNASTFAARVIAATLSDVHSAVTGAIGALKGPLHGGANEGVMRMLYEIDKAGADPVEYVKGMLAARQKISGFGHRVYKTEDPRATHLRKMSEQLGRDAGVPSGLRCPAPSNFTSTPTRSSTPTWTSTPPPLTPPWASTSTSTRPSSPSAAWPDGPPTSSSSSTTTASSVPAPSTSARLIPRLTFPWKSADNAERVSPPPRPGVERRFYTSAGVGAVGGHGEAGPGGD
jgi:citrate synthase